MFGLTEFRALAAAGFEYRTLALCGVTPAERRADLDEDGHTLRGMAIVFNKRSLNLGGWFEIIRPEAVDRTLADASSEVRALVDHETRLVLGNSMAGTMRMKKGKTGLNVEVDTGAQSYARDVAISIGRGDVHGMSFRFRVAPDGDEWDILPDGTIVRYVNDMRFDEVSFVTFPAYTDTTADVVREMTERGLLDGANAMRSLEAFKARNGASVEFLRRLEKLKSSGWKFAARAA